MTRRTYTRVEKVALAAAALDALELGATTHADKMRIDLVRVGFRALDDAWAELRAKVPEPDWLDCMCAEISKSDRPCMPCEAKVAWRKEYR